MQVRDLKVRDSEAVVRWGGLLHAAPPSSEECERLRACASLRLPPESDVPHVQHSRAAALMRSCDVGLTEYWTAGTV